MTSYYQRIRRQISKVLVVVQIYMYVYENTIFQYSAVRFSTVSLARFLFFLSIKHQFVLLLNDGKIQFLTFINTSICKAKRLKKSKSSQTKYLTVLLQILKPFIIGRKRLNQVVQQQVMNNVLVVLWRTYEWLNPCMWCLVIDKSH